MIKLTGPHDTTYILNLYIDMIIRCVISQVELHVHLDGSVRPETIWDLARYISNCLGTWHVAYDIVLHNSKALKAV